MKSKFDKIILIIITTVCLINCSKNNSENSSKKLPTVTTKQISNSSTTSVSSGGDITDNGNDQIIQSGVVYSTNPNPTLETDTKIISNTNTSSFLVEITNLTAGTNYNVRAFATNSVGTSYGSNITLTTTNVFASIVTKPITFNSINAIISGGDISGTETINSRGICISILPNPTVPDTSNGNGIGSFISTYSTQLATTYYIRAYAEVTNRGLIYGNQITYTTIPTAFTSGNGVSDFDNNNYPTINLSNQEWMQKNLNVSHFRNGDIIPQIQDPIAWFNATGPAWCYYQNNTSNGTIYGKLYNHFAVEDVRGLAPLGWHIPTSAEYTILINYLGLRGPDFQGGSLKETGFNTWNSPNPGATNISGFTALAGGYMAHAVSGSNNTPVSFSFSGKGNYTDFWCSDNLIDDNYRSIFIENNFNSISHISFGIRRDGFYVRCLKN